MPRSFRKPKALTRAELAKALCSCGECDRKARFQWNACADENVWRPICEIHDVLINIAVLRITQPTSWRELVIDYCEDINVDWRIHEEIRAELGDHPAGHATL